MNESEVKEPGKEPRLGLGKELDGLQSKLLEWCLILYLLKSA